MRKKHTITKYDIGKVFKVYNKHNEPLGIEKIKAVRGKSYHCASYYDSGSVFSSSLFYTEQYYIPKLYSFIEMSRLEQLIVFGKVL